MEGTASLGEKVQVLMSTYNGQHFIAEQLDSILHQKSVFVECLIRDDGSLDQTPEIISQYMDLHSNITLIKSIGNLGFANSFYELVEKSGDYDYFAFSDQDDVWLPEKLKVAVEQINGSGDIPEMYFCNCELVDEKLNHLNFMFDGLHLSDTKFERLLENRAAGCTIVFNRKSRDMFLKSDRYKIQFHDFWMYVICSYFGKVVYDPEPHILYRQHLWNQVGSQPTLKKLWKQRKKQISDKNAHMREYMAQELLRNFNELLSAGEKKKIRVIAQYRNSSMKRMKLFFYREVRMSSLKKQFWFKIHTLIGDV